MPQRSLLKEDLSDKELMQEAHIHTQEVLSQMISNGSPEILFDKNFWPIIASYLCIKDIIKVMRIDKRIYEVLKVADKLWLNKAMEYGLELNPQEKELYQITIDYYREMWNYYK
jgi:hypothetical protein